MVLRVVRLQAAASAPAAVSSHVLRLFQRALLGTPASVDENVGTGDEARLLRAEVDCEPSDLFELTPASDGNFGNELPVFFRIVDDGRVHFRGERTGADAVDGDAFRCEFEGEGLS